MCSLEKTEGFFSLVIFNFQSKMSPCCYNSFVTQLKLIQFSHPLNLKVAKSQKRFSLGPHPQNMWPNQYPHFSWYLNLKIWGCDLTHFFENGTEVKIPPEINPPSAWIKAWKLSDNHDKRILGTKQSHVFTPTYLLTIKCC